MNKLFNSQTGTFLTIIGGILLVLFNISPCLTLNILASACLVVGLTGALTPDQAEPHQITNRAFVITLLVNFVAIIKAGSLAFSKVIPIQLWLPVLLLLVILEVAIFIAFTLFNLHIATEPVK